MLAHGTMSAQEGIRLAMVAVGIVLSLYAAVFAYNGSLVFASPIRQRMVLRRRIQMIGYLIIFLVIGVQTLDAALAPDPPVMTSAGLAVHYVMMSIIGILIAMIMMFSIGWIGTATVVGNAPLQPDPDTAIIQASIEARDILHEINNDMTTAIGLIDLILDVDNGLSDAKRHDLELAQELLESVAQKQNAVHTLIRSQTASIVPSRSEQT